MSAYAFGSVDHTVTRRHVLGGTFYIARVHVTWSGATPVDGTVDLSLPSLEPVSYIPAAAYDYDASQWVSSALLAAIRSQRADSVGALKELAAAAASACPTDARPDWLVALAPWLLRWGSAEMRPIIQARYEACLLAWHSVTPEAWFRIYARACEIVVREVMRYESDKRMLDLCENAIRACVESARTGSRDEAIWGKVGGAARRYSQYSDVADALYDTIACGSVSFGYADAGRIAEDRAGFEVVRTHYAQRESFAVRCKVEAARREASFSAYDRMSSDILAAIERECGE